MNITREQYEADIRKAKAQALRDYADAIILEVGIVTEWTVEETAEDARLHADAVENP